MRTLAWMLMLGVPGLTRAGGDTVPLTPGWDGFPALISGQLAWSIPAGSATLTATFTLDGASPNEGHMVGLHHMDVVRLPNLGAGCLETGNGLPQSITREGNTTVVSSDEFGFLTTDGSGDVVAPFTLVGVNPGIYAAQFHIRQGGPPGCPATACSSIYRTGGVFAGTLVRFAVPGAAAFWSGDGHAGDEVGSNDALWSGSAGYRSGHFRQGFDLDGASHLAIANPVANGLAPVSGFSVVARVVQDLHTGDGSLLNLRTAADASGFALDSHPVTPGTLSFAVNTSGVAGAATTLSAPGFGVGTAHQIAAIFDAATHSMALYRDGYLVAARSDVPGTTMAVLGSEALEIGRNIASGNRFTGLIDELLLFDRALTPAELRSFGTLVFVDGFETDVSSP